MEATLSIGGRHSISRPVMLDRVWARAIGADRAKGARRVGSFYRLPRAEYLRLMEAQGTDPSLRWTASDDRALDDLLKKASEEESCVGCG